MIFHAKALEMYTACHRALTTMSEEEDLEVGDFVIPVEFSWRSHSFVWFQEFRHSLRPTSARNRLQMQHAASKNSLNTTSGMSASSAPNGRKGGPPTEITNGTNTMYSTTLNTTSQSMYTTDTQVQFLLMSSSLMFRLIILPLCSSG